MSSNYYVYVYIDPRSYEEFYYGKGKGSRKDAHLADVSDSAKVARIKEILDEGERPIVRVIASGLTEHEALMVETTLIWKLGRTLDNIASGHFVSRFRKPNTYHKELAHFDFENGIYYVNVGEGESRNWDDCRKFGFLAAGGDNPSWRKQISSLVEGDVVVAYLTGHGYVGVGRVRHRAVPYSQFLYSGVPLGAHDLVQPNVSHDAADVETCDYIVSVDWRVTVPREEAKRISKKNGHYAPQRVRASLSDQPATIAFVEETFDVDLRSLADNG
jgi:hypothetical protein